MNNKEKALIAIKLLEERYPIAECSLPYEKPHELLIAVRLAAQCTDARVNTVTPTLFSRYPTLEALASAKLEDIEAIVRPCGFFRIKARDIILMSQMLVREYGSVVPDTIEELLRLPGVGRKTANLIVGDVYGKPAIVCDTHCIRITNLLGLASSKDPLKVENQLREILPPEKSNDFCHRLVLFGREVCIARRPQCQKCEMAIYCNFFTKNPL